MTGPVEAPASGNPLVSGKAIFCALPDDGTDKRLLLALRSELGVVRANCHACRGMAVLAHVRTEPGKLPTPSLVRLVQVVVDEPQAKAVFDFIYERAGLAKPGRGTMWQMPLIGCTHFALPEDVPDEKDM